MQGTEFVNEFSRMKFHGSLVDHNNLKKLHPSKIYIHTVNGYEIRLRNKIWDWLPIVVALYIA